MRCNRFVLVKERRRTVHHLSNKAKKMVLLVIRREG